MFVMILMNPIDTCDVSQAVQELLDAIVRM